MKNKLPIKALHQDTPVFALCVACSFVIGFAVNQSAWDQVPIPFQSSEEKLKAEVQRLKGQKLINPPTPEPTKKPPLEGKAEWSEVGTTEVQRIIETKSHIIVDARSHAFYELGHIPTAKSLPKDDFARFYSQLNLKPDQAILIYCIDPLCEDSKKVANALQELGHNNLTLYPGGWEAWQEEGQ